MATDGGTGIRHVISFSGLVPLAPWSSPLLCSMGFCFKLAPNETELKYDEAALVLPCFAFKSLKKRGIYML